MLVRVCVEFSGSPGMSLQEPADEPVELLGSLHHWHVPALRQDVDLGVSDAVAGDLGVGHRHDGVLRAPYYQRGDLDLLQSSNNVIADLAPPAADRSSSARRDS